MQFLPVIKDFNVFKYIPLGLSSGFIFILINQFYFQGTVETFHHRVVPAVAFATHGTDYTIF